jgi:hypothetical protein
MSNYAFIDGNNLHKGIENQGWHLDYRKFRKYLEDKYNAKKVCYFIGFDPTRQVLYKYLNSCGYSLIFKPTSRRGKVLKGNVDSELVLVTVAKAGNYEKAIIVAGDGDYFCLAGYLDALGKMEMILAPSRNECSVLLRRGPWKITFMDDLRKKLERVHPN